MWSIIENLFDYRSIPTILTTQYLFQNPYITATSTALLSSYIFTENSLLKNKKFNYKPRSVTSGKNGTGTKTSWSGILSFVFCLMLIAGGILGYHFWKQNQTPKIIMSLDSVYKFGNKTKGSKPNIIFVMLDDAGWNDFGYHNSYTGLTPNINNLANNGIRLDRHYAHWHDSPTRRMFLTGRQALHTGWQTSQVKDDDIDVRWKLFPERIKKEGYINYWIGKGGTGFKYTDQLPTNRGFDYFMGFLSEYQSYRSSSRWENDMPMMNITTFATHLYGSKAVDIIQKHDFEKKSLFMFYSDQAPRYSPDYLPEYGGAATAGGNCPYFEGSPARKLLACSDYYIGNIINALKNKKVNDKTAWDNTLFIVTTANGGYDGGGGNGNNYPLRGEKRSSFDGAIRTATVVSGGFIPTNLYGMVNKALFHISDWYSTFCYLAGVSPEDSVLPPNVYSIDPVKCRNCRDGEYCIRKYNGLPTCISSFNPKSNPYGTVSYPRISSKNILSTIINPNAKFNDVHETLVIDPLIMIYKEFKLILGEPCANIDFKNNTACKSYGKIGWIKEDGSGWNYPKVNDRCLGVTYNQATLNITVTCKAERCIKAAFTPCLFNIIEDPKEEVELSSAYPNLIPDLWEKLNNITATQYTRSLPGKEEGLSEIVSKCLDEEQAHLAWASATGGGSYSYQDSGMPLCNIPGIF